MPDAALPFTPITAEAEEFYAESLRILKKSGIPFLLAGTYAVKTYTGIDRPTKDMDVFCRAGDYPRILMLFQELGYETEVEDERWIAKVKQGPWFFDVIFNSTVAISPVNDQWFAESRISVVHGTEVQITPPTELIWSKVFLQDRYRYDGADVAHLILKQSHDIDWKRLLSYMEQYWEVLLMHVLNFRFIYPSERENVPRWLYDELLKRLNEHADLPIPRMKICRGRLFSRPDYLVDVAEWGYADLVGMPGSAAMPERKPVRVAAIADLHVMESSVRPFRDLFKEISEKADVLALCGDLTNVGGAREADILAEDLESCTIPKLGVLGNHDYECGRGEEVKATLQEAGLHILEGHVYEVDGVGFAGVKGFGGGFGSRMLSAFGEGAVKSFVQELVDEAMRLENSLRSLATERRVVLLHYAPIAATVEGEPLEIFPFLGSSRLAEVIDRFRVSAVFHGHAHRGAHKGQTPKGIPVYNVAQMIPKESGRPYALVEV